MFQVTRQDSAGLDAAGVIVRFRAADADFLAVARLLEAHGYRVLGPQANYPSGRDTLLVARDARDGGATVASVEEALAGYRPVR